MSYPRFFKELSLVSIVVVATLYLIHLIPSLSPFQGLSWISCLFFIFLTLFMFLAGKWASKSKNKHMFTNIALLFLVGKMLISATIIMVYNYTVKPDTKFFIIPFFIVYLFYTIFETYFMIKLGNVKTTK